MNCIEITVQSQLNFYCFQNLFIMASFGLSGHLHVIHNMYKMLGRMLAAFQQVIITQWDVFENYLGALGFLVVGA